ncbi:MAG: hypothetical protein IKM04_02575 [Clostridia bacterium]|nr:hypothetical protein [Clostridia bacterium]
MDSLIYVGLGALAGLIIGIVEKCKERKNPPPKKPVQTAKTDDELTEDEIFAIIYNSFYAG